MTRKSRRNWHLMLAGCGTVGLAGARALLCSEEIPLPASLVLVDCDKVQHHNALTCPEYAQFVGQPKVDALASLIGRRFARGLRSNTFCGTVEDFDWLSALQSVGDGELAAILAGLDDFQSRLCLTEDLRQTASRVEREILHVQVGLGRGQAVVCTYGNHWDDPCPACFLPRLPRPEPCVVFSQAGELVRGDLQHEVDVAARHTVALVAEALGEDAPRVANRKTVFTAKEPASPTFDQKTWPRRRRAGCQGPHCATPPVHWNRVIDKLASEETCHEYA
jgi:hypothetical protein